MATEFNPGGAASLDDAVRIRYEANADRIPFTGAKDTKLAGIAAGATANSPDATLLARANQTGTQTASTIVDFTETSQDAVGTMVDGSLVYVDATPLLQRAALTGHITAPAGSNTTALGSFTKSQLDVAVSDGNVLYVGDVTSNVTHTGDVTGSTALTIASAAVSYNKIQNVSAASRLLGRGSSGSGSPEEITLGSGLTMTGTTLAATGGGGGGSGTNDTRFAIYNNTGSTLVKGAPIYPNGGYDVGSNTPHVSLADADGSGAMPAVGLVLTSLSTANSGIALTTGLITELDTSGFTINDPLYISATGTLTITAPIVGLTQEVARVTRVHATLGEIVVRITEVGTPIIDGAAQLDTSGNKILQYGVAASAVNVIEVGSAPAGSPAKISSVGTDTNIDLSLVPKGTGKVIGVMVPITIALSDTITALTIGTLKDQFRLPFTGILEDVQAEVITAPTGSGNLTVDVNKNGATVLSTKLTFDASEDTTTTAAIARVISIPTFTKWDKVSFDVDSVSSTVTGTGLKITMLWRVVAW